MSKKFTAVILLFLWGLSTGVLAEPTAAQFARSVVKIESTIESTGRTVAVLGSERSGSGVCLLYTSPSPRDATLSRMPSSA